MTGWHVTREDQWLALAYVRTTHRCPACDTLLSYCGWCAQCRECLEKIEAKMKKEPKP